MHVDSLDWAAFALGSVGAEFQVVTPLELADVLGDWAGRFARALDTDMVVVVTAPDRGGATTPANGGEHTIEVPVWNG
jgi:hypothetical protein